MHPGHADEGRVHRRGDLLVLLDELVPGIVHRADEPFGRTEIQVRDVGPQSGERGRDPGGRGEPVLRGACVGPRGLVENGVDRVDRRRGGPGGGRCGSGQGVERPQLPADHR